MTIRKNRFAEASKKAAANTDEKLSADLNRLKYIDEGTLSKLFPNDMDRMYFNKLIRKLNRYTQSNLRAAAYKSFALKAGAGALKAVKNLMGGC